MYELLFMCEWGFLDLVSEDPSKVMFKCRFSLLCCSIDFPTPSYYVSCLTLLCIWVLFLFNKCLNINLDRNQKKKKLKKKEESIAISIISGKALNMWLLHLFIELVVTELA